MKPPEPDPDEACGYCVRCYAEAHRLDEDYVRERFGGCFRAAGFGDVGILGHMSPEKFIGLLRLAVEEAGMENAPLELPVRYSYMVIDRMPEYHSEGPAPEIPSEEKRERMRYAATYFAEAHRIPVDEAVELFERCDLEELISFGWNSLYGYMDLPGKDRLPNAAVRVEFLRKAVEDSGGVCPELVCPYTVMGRTYDRRLDVGRDYRGWGGVDTVSGRNSGHRRQAIGSGTLPASVAFSKIDYDGEHMDLAVPIVATVTLDADDVFIFNDEARVRGSGATLEEAMEDFCGSFLLCYKILRKGGPGCNRAWGPIMRHLGYSYGG